MAFCLLSFLPLLSTADITFVLPAVVALEMSKSSHGWPGNRTALNATGYNEKPTVPGTCLRMALSTPVQPPLGPNLKKMHPYFTKVQTEWREGLSYTAVDFEEWLGERSWSWNKKPLTDAKVTAPFGTESRLASSACQFSQLPTRPTSSPSPPISLVGDGLSQIPSLNSSFSSTFSSSSSSSFSSSADSVTPPSSPILTNPAVLFTTNLFEVRKSPKGGWGAFALEDIEKDTVVFSEAPLFRAKITNLYYEFENLTREQRMDYRTLAYWYELNPTRVMAIFLTNRFVAGDSHGIFLKSSRFNHACPPVASCRYAWDEEKGVLITTAGTAIKKSQEITIAYTDTPAMLYEDYGFYCDCICCPPPEQARREAEALK